jgi:hypothetical protein
VGRQQRRDLGEVGLEAGRRDDLEQPGRRVRAVPERVRDPARLDDEVARARVAHLVADLHADLALDHVGVLVLVAVDVHRRRQRARRDRVLDEREAAARARAVDHEAHAEASELDDAALSRAKHDGRRHRKLLCDGHADAANPRRVRAH